MPEILIASQNIHKIAELTPLLEQAGFTVTDARMHQLPEPAEDGKTFTDNARIKAQAAVKATGMAVLADDSGLVVEALGDFPGVDTAPYAQCLGGYSQAVEDLFNQLDGRPSDCYLTTVVIVLFPDGREILATGRIDGVLQREQRGDGEFGFDRWFEIKGLGRTYAELSIDEKNKISHRGQAMKDLLQQLKQMHELRAVS
ncbi:MAG: Nucleoside-triphosphatase rdgB [Alphaproteobacteria bacterium]|nr:Nucleoside-triphosphatase rdgB [Alphaproteobacteria bacterium]